MRPEASNKARRVAARGTSPRPRVLPNRAASSASLIGGCYETWRQKTTVAIVLHDRGGNIHSNSVRIAR